MTYIFIGVVLLIMVGATYYFISNKLETGEEVPDSTKTMFTLTSSAFENSTLIPTKYTCDAENVSPPLQISGVPDGTVSLVLIMDDPDVPKILKPDGVFDHWVVYSLPPTTTEIPEGAVTGAEGLNGRGTGGYTGPCPPPEYEPTEHRYFFTLYALDTEISFFKMPTKAEVKTAIQGHVLSEAQLLGTYDRAQRGAE